ncbi:MAG: hypothetical protein Q9224_007216, partial [Gallowayella concinna]
MTSPPSRYASGNRSISTSTSSVTLQQLPDKEHSNGQQRSEQDRAPASDKDERERYRVDWEPNDPKNPLNWKPIYKGWLTFQLGMLALTASLGSSIITPAQSAIAKYAHISPQVATLSLSLYVLGFAFGPLLWGPMSE